MAASFAYSMRTETSLTTYALERAQARALAEAAIVYAVQKLLLQPDPENSWPVEGTPRTWRFGNGEVSISAVESTGKIDINHANRELLAGLFSNEGLNEDEVEALLDAIEDWRDPDDLRRLQGAEDSEYQAAGRITGPKNAPFESLEELLQVLGMTPELYEQVVNSLTVSGHKGINPAAASLIVLSAVPNIDIALVTDYVEQRSLSIEQDLPLPPAPPLGAYLSKARGLAYHMKLEVRLDSGTQTAVEATIAQARRPGQAYHIIAWREG